MRVHSSRLLRNIRHTAGEALPGVYVLPKLLSEREIARILQLHEMKCHHSEGHHGTGGPYDPPPVPSREWTKDRTAEKRKKKKQKPPEDSGGKKRRIIQFRAKKPHHLSWVAKRIARSLPMLPGVKSCSVDPWMQLYRLQEGAGVVPQHVDEDFEGSHGMRATFSIILYLNDAYEGGETIFYGTTHAPPVEVGGGLLFRHDVLHEGRAVTSGVKYVLKTDLFCR